MKHLRVIARLKELPGKFHSSTFTRQALAIMLGLAAIAIAPGIVILTVAGTGESSNTPLFPLLIWVVCTGLLFTGGYFALLLRIQRRLQRLEELASRMSQGDLRPAEVEGAADEIGSLGAALATAQSRLGKMVAKLQTAARDLGRATTEISAASSQQSELAMMQTVAVSETGNTLTGLRKNSQKAAERAEAVIELASRSEEVTLSGRAAVEESLGAMNRIRDHVQTISGTITGLVDRVARAQAIIEAVSDLAEQSNVLALNASIEAARAGDHGRGFGVVAREVRSLAERSKKSTADVRKILEEITRASRNAFGAIAEGQQITATGAALAEKADASIAQLDQAISESSVAAREIAEFTRQQATGVDEIWEAMQEIERAMSQAMAGVTQTETSSRQLNDLSEQMAQMLATYQVVADVDQAAG